MSLTHIPESLLHDEDQIRRDDEGLLHLVRVATELAAPFAKSIINDDAAQGAAILWIEDALALLKQVAPSVKAGKTDIANLELNLAESLGALNAPATEAEILRHASDIGDVLVRSWVDALWDAKRSVHTITSVHLLPIKPSDDSERWANFWGSLEVLGLNRVATYDLLYSFCRRIEATSMLDSLRLVTDLEVRIDDLRQALAIADAFRSENWLEEEVKRLRDMSDGFERVRPEEFERVSVGETIMLTAERPVYMLGGTFYECSPDIQVDRWQPSVIGAALNSYISQVGHVQGLVTPTEVRVIAYGCATRTPSRWRGVLRRRLEQHSEYYVSPLNSKADQHQF